MSSTIRTRIWSAIRQWSGRSRCWGMAGALSPERWTGAGPGVRRARRAWLDRSGGSRDRLGPGRLAPRLGREDGLDELRDRNREVVGQLLERCALRAGGRRDDGVAQVVDEVLRGAEDQADRAVQLGELDHLGLGGGHRQ